MEAESSSFRDDSGFIFRHDNRIFRQVNKRYKENFDYLVSCGLYEDAVQAGWLIEHADVSAEFAELDAYKVIEPKLIPFISYPYEWCFSQLKDAAVLTITLQQKALEHGMILKDASAYNIQFLKGKPIFIDTLSFEKYEDGKPWIAYRQFCENFLAPLLLMQSCDIRLNKLMEPFIGGIPLDLVSSCLPPQSILNPSISMHIMLQARMEASYRAGREPPKHTLPRRSLLSIVENLKAMVSSFNCRKQQSYWSQYAFIHDYSDQSMQHKLELVGNFIDRAKPKSLWDFGSNTGRFSRLASDKGTFTLSLDSDPICVEQNYNQAKANDEQCILPLVMDVTNPSPAIGWNNTERLSLASRGPCDTLLALGLIHHISVTNNVPFDMVASYFASICKTLVLEFVPRSDSQVKTMLLRRSDGAERYSQDEFERAFSRFFKIELVQRINGSDRQIFFMQSLGEPDKSSAHIPGLLSVQ